MKCPYQIRVTHKPERTRGSGVEYAEDITRFGECLKSECPFYDIDKDTITRQIKEHCLKAEREVKQ